MANDPYAPERRDVLLIEDDKAMAEMYAFGLGVKGYQVRIATSGETALMESGPERPVGVIVLDLEIRTAGGLAILDDLRHREATAGTPVIVLFDEDVEYQEAERHGASACLRKFRITPKELAGQVERSLRETA